MKNFLKFSLAFFSLLIISLIVMSVSRTAIAGNLPFISVDSGYVDQKAPPNFLPCDSLNGGCCDSTIIGADTTCRTFFTFVCGGQMQFEFNSDLNFKVQGLAPTATLILISNPDPLNLIVTQQAIPDAGSAVTLKVRWNPTPLLAAGILQFQAKDALGNILDNCIVHFDFPLPVELASFVSIIQNNDVTLKWTTTTEHNNARFEIERANGINQEWNKIGTVLGNGNSSQSISYSFADRGLNVGSYNYRLKQVDYNGNFTYHNLSNDVAIGVPTRFNLTQNYPNPFNPSTKIDFELPKDGNVNLYVYDNAGKQVSTITSGFRTAGYYTVQFNASNLASGIYFYKIQVTAGDQSFEKVMKMALLK